MHELTRRTYLQSLGIDSYVSRGQLPGAAPSHRLVVVRDRAPATAPAANLSSGLAKTLSATPDPGLNTDKTVGKPVVGSGSTGGTPRAPVAIPAFSIAAIVCGDWLWIEELSAPALSANQLQLVRGMCRALGVDNQKPELSQFNWPIHRNSQLDLGEDAAGAGLHGFIQRKLDQQGCSGLVMLGSACRQRMGGRKLDAQRCINTSATAEMLLDPLLKKQVWRDLRPFASNS